ncbi:SH3 domain-containing protein [Xinfangfangia sp. D13-10-4-6]|nr:SH3 domain-containing protein [Pseudogemmobacter hezensis]
MAPEITSEMTDTGSGSLYADPTDGGALSANGTLSANLDGAESGLQAPYQAGDIRTVSASSVNVRLGPSTETSVVGRLTEGEAVRVLGAVDSDWVEIAIEGDGVSGYIASRFLAPGAW